MRKELELSQREFAARLGTTTQTLADWKRGGRRFQTPQTK
ncbi:helix-turn-helix domain-containing protein [Xylella fastidiosa]